MVRAYSTTKNNDSFTSADCSDLVVFSDADKDKLEILKYIKGKSGIYKDPSDLLLNKLKPYFVTGFTDGEGSFIISITKNPESRLGFRVKAIFRINLHKEDLVLLKLIQSYFDGAGNIGDYKDTCNYTV